MMRGNVQRLEIVKVIFDFGPLGDIEPEFAEHLVDPIHGQRYRMQAAGIDTSSRQAYVNLLALQARCDCGIAKHVPARLKPLLHLVFSLVNCLPGRGTLLNRQFSKVLQLRRELALLTEISNAHTVECRHICSIIDSK